VVIVLIKAIVFDLDGTLVDTMDLWVRVWGETLRRFGIQISDDRVRPLIGLSPKGIIEGATHKECSPEDEKMMVEYRTKLLWELAYMAKPFADAEPALKSLKSRGIKIAVASSSPDNWIKEMLDRAGISNYIDSYVSATKVEKPKPAPDVFIEAFRSIGHKPSEGMVVGDRESDTLPGMSIGAVSVLIDRINEFRDPKADFVIRSLGELEGLIGKL